MDDMGIVLGAFNSVTISDILSEDSLDIGCVMCVLYVVCVCACVCVRCVCVCVCVVCGDTYI